MQTLVLKQEKKAKRAQREMDFDSEDEAAEAQGDEWEDPHKGKNWKVRHVLYKHVYRVHATVNALYTHSCSNAREHTSRISQYGQLTLQNCSNSTILMRCLCININI